MEGLERKTQWSRWTTVKILCFCHFCGGCKPANTSPHRAPPSNVSVGRGPAAWAGWLCWNGAYASPHPPRLAPELLTWPPWHRTYRYPSIPPLVTQLVSITSRLPRGLAVTSASPPSTFSHCFLLGNEAQVLSELVECHVGSGSTPPPPAHPGTTSGSSWPFRLA